MLGHEHTLSAAFFPLNALILGLGGEGERGVCVCVHLLNNVTYMQPKALFLFFLFGK